MGLSLPPSLSAYPLPQPASLSLRTTLAEIEHGSRRAGLKEVQLREGGSLPPSPSLPFALSLSHTTLALSLSLPLSPCLPLTLSLTALAEIEHGSGRAGLAEGCQEVARRGRRHRPVVAAEEFGYYIADE